MGWWLLGRPRWVHGVLVGLVFGLAMGTGIYFSGEDDWLGGLIGGLISGAGYGLVVTRMTGSTGAAVLTAAGPLSDDDLAGALEAARRGLRPDTSPDAAAGARRMVEYQLDVLDRQRSLTVLIFVGGSVALAAVAAVTRSWWWALLAAVWIATAVRQLTAPRRLGARLATLRGDDRMSTGGTLDR